MADQIEADRARERRLAEIRELQDQVQDRDLERRREEQEAQTAAYVTQQSLRDSPVEQESQIDLIALRPIEIPSDD